MSQLLDQIEADSKTFFDEFGHALVWSGGTIQCLPDDNWIELDGENAGTSIHQVTAIIHKSDASELAVNTPVNIDGISYFVRDIQKDTGRTGDVLLVLSSVNTVQPLIVVDGWTGGANCSVP